MLSSLCSCRVWQQLEGGCKVWGILSQPGCLYQSWGWGSPGTLPCSLQGCSGCAGSTAWMAAFPWALQDAPASQGDSPRCCCTIGAITEPFHLFSRGISPREARGAPDLTGSLLCGLFSLQPGLGTSCSGWFTAPMSSPPHNSLLRSCSPSTVLK